MSSFERVHQNETESRPGSTFFLHFLKTLTLFGRIGTKDCRPAYTYFMCKLVWYIEREFQSSHANGFSFVLARAW
jgi:hypothetical protein